MHAYCPVRETLRQQIERMQLELDRLFGEVTCRVGGCWQPAAVMKLSRTPTGARLELLCSLHARPRLSGGCPDG